MPATNAIEATVASGIRSVFCYTPTPRIQSWKPELTLSGGILDDWVLETLSDFGNSAPFGDGRVQLGLAFDGFTLPKEQVVSLYKLARKIGVKVITTHYVRTVFSMSMLTSNKID